MNHYYHRKATHLGLSHKHWSPMECPPRTPRPLSRLLPKASGASSEAHRWTRPGPCEASKLPSVRYNDAVEEALCFGWIDSTYRPLSETLGMQRFTPRRKIGENYSQPNVERLRWVDAKVVRSGRGAGGRMKWRILVVLELAGVCARKKSSLAGSMICLAGP